PPAVAIAAGLTPRGQRATVGTMTEIVDYLRLLFARAGTLVCIQCGNSIRAKQPADVVAAIATLPAGTRGAIGFPSRPESEADIDAWIAALKEEGFVRVQIGERVFRPGEDALPPAIAANDVWVLVDRLEAGKTPTERLTDSVETAFTRGGGRLALLSDAQT